MHISFIGLIIETKGDAVEFFFFLRFFLFLIQQKISQVLTAKPESFVGTVG